MAMETRRRRAVQMLVLANACWGLSFPTMKALAMLQQPIWPHSTSWFVASLAIAIRFGLAALVMLLVCARTVRYLTRLELRQGLGLGVFAAAGLVFQMDGLSYTSASTSAFLTQFYSLTIPLWLATQERRWPPITTLVSCLMVMTGVAVLSVFDWRELRMGRGELETLIGSTIFTGQILWLQRPKFAGNNVNHFTLVMFAVISLSCLPLAVVTGHPLDSWPAGYRPAAAWCFMAILTSFCTFGGYLLMNYWQPHITATQAGLIYCLEPVFASLFAFFLPAWFSALSGIQYANEKIGWSLLLGGGLITAANVLIQQSRLPPKTVDPETSRVSSS